MNFFIMILKKLYEYINQIIIGVITYYKVSIMADDKTKAYTRQNFANIDLSEANKNIDLSNYVHLNFSIG